MWNVSAAAWAQPATKEGKRERAIGEVDEKKREVRSRRATSSSAGAARALAAAFVEMPSVTARKAVRAILLSLVLLACSVPPPHSEAASLTDRIFAGFLNFGRGFSNATQGLVFRVRGLVSRAGGPSTSSSSGSKGAAVRDLDIFSSVCSLSGTKRRLLIKCLNDNNENLLKPDWQECIGSAKIEVLTTEDLYHWSCSRLSSATELPEFRNTSQCLLDGMNKSEIAAGIRECKGSSRIF